MSNNTMDQFKEVCRKTHTEQAVWWLNGFWNEAQEYAEDVWVLAHNFIEIQTGEPVRYGKRAKNKKQGSDLDEFQAHRVLEKCGETLTVREMRQRLLKLDVDNNKRLALTEYLINKYLPDEEKVIDMVAEANQGGVDSKLLKEAEDKLDEAQSVMDSAIESFEAAKTALAEAKTASANADKSLKASKDSKALAEEALKTQQLAEAEVEAALQESQAAADALEEEEKRFQSKMDKLQKQIDDKNSGTVKRNSAINRLAQMKATDPLPLQKAKITQLSALKKVKKEKKKAEKATQQCSTADEDAKKAATEAQEAKELCDKKQEESVSAKESANNAKEEAEEGFRKAGEAIGELKKQGTGVPEGKVWWMERVLAEKKKFMPK